MKPISITWAFRLKQIDSKGKEFLDKAKSCLRGDRQKPFIDFDPGNLCDLLGSHESIRMLISCTVGERNTFLEGGEIDNDYLHGELDVPIIVQKTTDSTKYLAKPG